jgi:beta-galactosidase
MTLIVNDEVITIFEFVPTGSWKQEWKFVGAKVKFRPGANSIELKTKGESGPHIDEMYVD